MYQGIIEELKKSLPLKKEDITRIKAKIAKKYSLKRIPSNAEILAHASEEDRRLLLPYLRRKPVRTISGVAVVAVMARPYPCPGECIYCPRGENAPQSYTGKEPATLRAIRAGYDPYIQTKDRLEQLKKIGHPIDKVELIVMGGTFPAQPKEYQEYFVTRCLDAMNQKEAKSLEEAQKLNEKARIRCVGITFETRPDFAMEKETDLMLRLGGTRVEVGVQTISDEIYKKVKRGHGVKEVVKATRILKDSGLKVGYHMMPGLFSTFEEDLRMFKRIFQDEKFKPDTIKIYPTLVIKGTKLYELWKRGEYTPYNSEEAAELIVEIKKLMPKWVRTMRIQRDIPAQLIEAGVKRGDLGAMVYRKLKELGIRCRCIRCRDVGHLAYKEGIKVNEDAIEILVEAYKASEGEEHFISVEDLENDALIAYLRLRFPSKKAHRKEINEKTALIRELRVLGPVVPIGEKIKEAEQHKGFGARLLEKAEEIALKHCKEKILITSAIGTREYYRRFGYKREGPYMGKVIV